MTTPWTPPGEDLPEPAAQPWATAPAPTQPYPPHPSYPPTYANQPPYPGGPHPDGTPPSKSMAGWALALSIVGCLVVTILIAIPLAIVVLVESSKDPRDRGKGMAIAALVISGVWVLVLLFGAAADVMDSSSTSSPDPFSDLPVDQTDKLPPAKLRVGNCFDDATLAGIDAGDGSVESGLVTLVPCNQPHDFETYNIFRIEGADFPGRAEVRRQAAVGCAKEFKPYVGRAYGPSDLDYWVYYPTSKSWAILSDHGVTCVVGEPGVKTSGSLHGSRR